MKTAETAVARALERLGHREVLEDFGARFPVPHSPRYELHYFRAVHRGQLTALAVRIEPGARAGRVKSLVLRGRLRRLLGDAAGAIGDFRKALSLDGAAPEAHLFLGEALLNRPEAVECLSRAAAQDPKSPWPFLYRGAANLMTGNLKAATRDLETFTCRRPKTCLGYLLLGLSLKKIPSALRAFAGAAKNDPTCSAAWILLARLQKERRRRGPERLRRRADYAHIALPVGTRAAVDRILRSRRYALTARVRSVRPPSAEDIRPPHTRPDAPRVCSSSTRAAPGPWL